MPTLGSITIYPIKSLGPVPVASARIVGAGGLAHDREFALFDEHGKYINGKRNEKIHALDATVDFGAGAISLRRRGSDEAPALFDLQSQHTQIEAWLADYFGKPVTLKRNCDGGFPDDAKAPGPTLIGAQTLAEVASWYEGLPVAEVHTRFRANLEIADSPAFWEDRLFAGPDEVVRFKIGEVLFEGTNPCQRCVVPTRSTQTGEAYPGFSLTFQRRREEMLPAWANANRFNHFYRLAVNTCVPSSEVGKVLNAGDEVILL